MVSAGRLRRRLLNCAAFGLSGPGMEAECLFSGLENLRGRAV